MSTINIKTYTFEGPEEGPHIFFLGGVHGDEPCGTNGIEAVLEHLNKGEIRINKGQVTFIPVCNPKAREQKKRFTERNLNRRFYPQDNPKTYEDELINELCPLLVQADILVDIHSYSRGGLPFALTGEEFPTEEVELARACGASYILDGLEKAYADTNIEIEPRECHGTKEWARENGAYGITLECGQHDDPRSTDIATYAILNTLKTLGFSEIPQTLLKIYTPAMKPTFGGLKTTVYMEAPGKLTKPWEQYEEIEEGTIMAVYDDGRKLHAPTSGFLLMPDIRDTMKPGEEWFYIGVKKEA